MTPLDKWLEEVEKPSCTCKKPETESCFRRCAHCGKHPHDKLTTKLIAIVRRQAEALDQIEDLPPLQERERRNIARAAQADVQKVINETDR